MKKPIDLLEIGGSVLVQIFPTQSCQPWVLGAISHYTGVYFRIEILSDKGRCTSVYRRGSTVSRTRQEIVPIPKKATKSQIQALSQLLE